MLSRQWDPIVTQKTPLFELWVQGAGNRNHYICDPTQPACIHAGCVGSLRVCRLAKARPTPMLCYYGRDMYRKMFDRYLGPNSPSLNRTLMDDTSVKRSIKKTFYPRALAPSGSYYLISSLSWKNFVIYVEKIFLKKFGYQFDNFLINTEFYCHLLFQRYVESLSIQKIPFSNV